MKKIRILLADDHTVTRMGLVMLISSEPDMKVIGEAENGEEAVRLARELNPDIVIIDLAMPVLSGAEATKAICNANPDLHVVVLTSYGTSTDLAKAVRNGASATLLKDTGTRELIGVLRTVYAGGTAIPDFVRDMLKEDGTSDSFTDKQLEILHSLSRGLSNADIAKLLTISENMVKKHLKAIFSKLGAATRAEAVAIALRKHLLKI